MLKLINSSLQHNNKYCKMLQKICSRFAQFAATAIIFNEV